MLAVSLPASVASKIQMIQQQTTVQPDGMLPMATDVAPSAATGSGVVATVSRAFSLKNIAIGGAAAGAIYIAYAFLRPRKKVAAPVAGLRRWARRHWRR